MKVFINDRVYLSGKDWVPDEAEFNHNMDSLLDLLNCFNFLKECQIFYNGEGFKVIFQNLSLVNEYFLTNKVDHLRTMIDEIDAVDWTQSTIQKMNYVYFLQLNGGGTTYNVTGESLAEAAEYKHINQKAVIINFISSDFNISNTVYVNKSNAIPPNDMILLSLEVINSKNDMLEFFLENREEIIFNLNSKHGENHNIVKYDNGKVISPLECTKEDANIILKLSIGGSIKSKELYAYDEKREKFIIFKSDNTSNPKSFHGYHPHDQNEIPEKIKSFLVSNLIFFGRKD